MRSKTYKPLANQHQWKLMVVRHYLTVHVLFEKKKIMGLVSLKRKSHIQVEISNFSAVLVSCFCYRQRTLLKNFNVNNFETWDVLQNVSTKTGAELVKMFYIVSNAMQHYLFSEHNERLLASIYLIEWESMLYASI